MEKFSLFSPHLVTTGGVRDRTRKRRCLIYGGAEGGPREEKVMSGRKKETKKGRKKTHPAATCSSFKCGAKKNKDFGDIQYSLNNKGNYRALIWESW